MMLLTALVILTSSCTEFAVLSSGAGIAVTTEKDIKMHAYDALTKGNDDSK